MRTDTKEPEKMKQFLERQPGVESVSQLGNQIQIDVLQFSKEDFFTGPQTPALKKKPTKSNRKITYYKKFIIFSPQGLNT